MLLRDLSDSAAWIKRIIFRLDRLEGGAPLENASVTNGRLRFIGGLLLLDSGATLQVIGHVTGEGDFEWSGPWKFDSGDGEIAGDVLLTGNFDLSGIFTAGNVRIQDGKITVGGMVLDPNNHDGMITLPNDGQLLGEASETAIYSPGPIRNGFVAKSDGLYVMSPEIASSTTGLRWLAVDVAGKLYQVSPGVGGPMGGPLEWPFPESTVTSEYGPRESPGPGGSTFHDGIDFGISEGTPIPAAGAGTVTLAGTNGGYGNCVIIDHGSGMETLYGHMQNTPPVSVGDHVSTGQTIGDVGSTGISFGAHLHFEVHIDGTPVNPRSKLP